MHDGIGIHSEVWFPKRSMPPETIESRAFKPDLLVRIIIDCVIDWNDLLLTQHLFVMSIAYINDPPDDSIILENVMKDLRINYVDYAKFWLHFGKHVVGSKFWNNRIRLNVKMSNMFTVSDKAFLLLVLENYHDRWIDLAQRIRNNLSAVSLTNTIELQYS